jgi:hypothetical protein
MEERLLNAYMAESIEEPMPTVRQTQCRDNATRADVPWRGLFGGFGSSLNRFPSFFAALPTVVRYRNYRFGFDL